MVNEIKKNTSVHKLYQCLNGSHLKQDGVRMHSTVVLVSVCCCCCFDAAAGAVAFVVAVAPRAKPYSPSRELSKSFLWLKRFLRKREIEIDVNLIAYNEATRRRISKRKKKTIKRKKEVKWIEEERSRNIFIL